MSLSPPSGQDVNDVWSFQHPQLYIPGQLNLYFSKTAFFKCVLHSGYCSLVLFFVPYAALYDNVRGDGKDVADYQSFAVLTQTCLLFTVSIQVQRTFPFCTVLFLGGNLSGFGLRCVLSLWLQLGLDMAYWTVINTIFLFGSLAMYFIVTFTMYSNGMFLLLPSVFSFVGEKFTFELVWLYF